MLIFYEGFEIEIFFSESHERYFSQIKVADTEFHFWDYDGYADSEAKCLTDSIEACNWICKERGKPDLFLPTWMPPDDGEF